MAFHAPDLAHAQGHINARHIIARLAQNHGDPRPRIGRAADDLLFPLVRFNAADAQLIGIGVLHGVDDSGDGKGGQFGGGVYHLFDL